MAGQMIIIELDGATWDIIDPMISRGQLPNFKLLKEQGVYGIIDTSYYGSPEIWTAIFTGKCMEKYGRPFFGIHRARLKAKRIWEIASEKGRRVGVLHSLLSWPPAAVDGFIIPDVFAMGPETFPARYEYFQKLYLSRHGKNTIQQISLLIRCLLTCGSPEILVDLFKLLLSSATDAKFLNTFWQRLMVVTKLDHNFFFRLYRSYRPQLSVFHVHSLDTVSHKYWAYMGKPGKYGHVIEDFYRQQDRLIGQLFTLIQGGDHLIVLSDHGFQEFSEGRGKFDLNVTRFREIFRLHSAARVVRIGDAFVLNLGGAAQEMDATGLTEELASARLTDGTRLFIGVEHIDENVHFRLPKPHLENRCLADEMVVFRQLGTLPFRELFREMAYVDTGVHVAGKGIFAAYGRDFMRHVDLGKIKIFDITPTLLTVIGLPIAHDMDGGFDRRWFSPQALESLRPRYIDSYERETKEKDQMSAEVYTRGEVEELEERLKMLGYL